MLDRTQSPVNFTFSDILIPEPEQLILDNGRPLYIFNQASHPVIKLEFIFRNGGSLSDSKLGTNSLLTKTLQSGSKKYSAQQIEELIGQKGAFIDTSGSFDYSIFSLFVLDKYLEDIIEVVNEILFYPTFPEEELTLQKEITINNLKTQNKKTNVLASKYFRQTLFGNNNPYGKILTENDLNNIDQSDLKSQFSKSFKNNFEILASGYITPKVRSIINSYFGQSDTYPLRTEKYNSKSNKDLPAINNQINVINSVQTSIRMGKKIINKNHPDYHSLVVVNHLLGGFFGSRLMSNLREEKGLTYGIHSSLVNFLNESYFVIGSDVKGENKELAITEITNELHKLSTLFVDVNEFKLVKNHLLGSFQNDLSSPLDLSDKYKNIYLYNLNYSYYKDFIDTIKNITIEEVQSISRKYLNPDSMIVITAGA